MSSTLSIPELISFKEDINKTINEYLEILQINGSDNNNTGKILSQVKSYYGRMKLIYENQYGSSDDETCTSFASDETSDNYDNDEDYGKLMENRVYANHNNIRDNLVSERENDLRRKILGLNYLISGNEGYTLGFNEQEDIDDTSVDPIDYSDKNDPVTFSDEDGDPVSNNTKISLIPFPESEIEIIVSETGIDYDDPKF